MTPKIRFRKIADLTPDPDNARTHSADQIDQLAASIDRFGWTNPVLADDLIRAGHGRVMAAELIYSRGGTIHLPPGRANGGAAIPKDSVPVLDCTGWTPDERRAYTLADNQLALQAGWNTEILLAQIEELKAAEFDIEIIGFDQAALDALAAGAPAAAKKPHGSLAGEFLIPPFSVLNAREGWWQDRKRVWLSLGIESEIGRGSDGKSARTFGQDLMRGEHVVGDATTFDDKDWIRQKQASGELSGGLASAHSGTSIFDPVLCELAYRWFCPKPGRVLDPFAGGSVRGIVAAALGRKYTGIDLRPEQITANNAQWPGVKAQIGDDDLFDPDWIVGDSRDVLSARHESDDDVVGTGFDFIFSCPPYGDLEVYSDDPADISTMGSSDFDNAYRSIIDRAVARLAPDRFACFVVGDYRDKQGIYANFVSKTIAAFEAAGAPLYNEGILITTAGSLPVRAAKQFRATRKLGKTHQNVLVFVKGDPRAATKACGDVDVSGAMAQFDD